MKNGYRIIALLLCITAFSMFFISPASAHIEEEETTTPSIAIASFGMEESVEIDDEFHTRSMQSTRQAAFSVTLDNHSFETFDLETFAELDANYGNDVPEMNSETIGALAVEGFNDVYVSSIGLGNGFSEPLPGSTSVQYTYNLVNPTSTSASGVILHIYVDNEYAGSLNISVQYQAVMVFWEAFI